MSPAEQRTSAAVAKVEREREAQREKWGEQQHDPTVWLAIIGEEYGELCRAMLNRGYGEIEAEATQLAACAVALVEYMKWGYA